MLIIPVGRQPDWRKPPLITLFLILVNVVIFFGVQGDDGRKQAEALRYYAQSQLKSIELPRYLRYLESVGKAPAETRMNDDKWAWLLMAMEADTRFMPRLHRGQIITPDEPEYASWRQQRGEFERLKQRIITKHFGFKTAAPTLSGLLGHMFLHGSISHLFGNMAILFIVGYLVEETLGKRRYLAFYLLAGLGAAGFDLAFNPERLAPGIGASGAVSGVMAMFVALYGLRRIRFFYWALVYFDFFHAPALLVLPLWIANELYQFHFNTGSYINYMAHLGGFVTGALLIWLQRCRGTQPIAPPQMETPSDPLPEQLARIDTLLGKLWIEEACHALRKLAKKHPYDLAVISRYYKVSRNTPASDDYHRAATLIFTLPDQHPATAALIHETWGDYLKLAKPSVRLGSSALVALIQSLALSGHTGDAERLLKALTSRAPQKVPRLLLLMAEAARKSGNIERCNALLERLQEDYPESEEARFAGVVVR